MDLIARKLIKNFIIFQDAINFCTHEDFIKLGAFDKSYIEEWSLLQGFNTPIGGIRWAGASGVVTGQLANIGIHLINANPRSNVPITFNDHLIQNAHGRKGWSHLKLLTKTAEYSDISEDRYNYTPNLKGYARAYSMFGKYAQSFNYALKNLNHQIKVLETTQRPVESYKNLYFIGKSLGISRSHLVKYIQAHYGYDLPMGTFDMVPFKSYFPEPLNEMSDEEFGPYSVAMLAGVLEGYISDTSPAEIIPKVDSEDPKIKGLGLMQALSLTSHEKHLLCRSDVIKNYFGEKGNLLQDRTAKVISIFESAVDSYERSNLEYICRLEVLQRGLKNPTLSPSEKNQLIEISYKNMMKEAIIPFITEDGNFADLRYLDSIIAFSEVSALAERPVGVFLSLIALKAIYTELVDGFVRVDAMTLRSEQSRIESVLTTIGIALESFLEKGVLDQQKGLKVGAFEHLQALMLSAHNPILSEKVKSRLTKSDLILESGESMNDEYLSAYEALRLHRQKIADSSTAFDYVINKASPVSKSYELEIYPYRSAEEFLFTLYDQRPSVFPYINMVSNGDSIFVVGHDANSKFFRFSSSIDIDILEITKEIHLKNKLSLETGLALCNSFTDFHTQLNQHLGVAEAILITPSVNLFPIPFEIILGQDCSNISRYKHTPVIQVNDYVAAKELIAGQGRLLFPDNMVGIGNPMADGGSDFLLGGGWQLDTQLRSGQFESFDSLPPLPDAEVEIIEASESFKNVKTYIGPEASLHSALKDTQDYSKKGDITMLVIATHGFAAGTDRESILPGLLSAENGQLEIVYGSDIDRYELKNSTIILSACDTAAGFVSEPDKAYTGLVKSFSDNGAGFIQSSLWPVNSKASRIVTTSLSKVWKTSGLVDAIRAAKAAPALDEYSWPFVYIYP